MIVVEVYRADILQDAARQRALTNTCHAHQQNQERYAGMTPEGRVVF
jgi:hypothetical protein